MQTKKPLQMKPEMALPTPRAAWVAISGSLLFTGLALIIVKVLCQKPVSAFLTTQDPVIVNAAHALGEVFNHVIVAVFLLAIWHMLYESFLAHQARVVLNTELDIKNNDFLEKMKAALKSGLNESEANTAEAVTKMVTDYDLKRNSREVGLVNVFATLDKKSTKQGALIESSKKLTVMVGSGEQWMRRHAESFKLRLADPDKETHFICVHPDSPLVEINARKLDQSADSYREQLHRTLVKLKEMNTCKRGLTIYQHKLADHSFVCIGNSGGFFMPKFVTLNSNHAPVFEFKRGNNNDFLKQLDEDLNSLKNVDNVCNMSSV